MTTLTTIANLDNNQETIKSFLNYAFITYGGNEYYYNNAWETDSENGEAVQDKKQVEVLQGKQYFDMLFEY